MKRTTEAELYEFVANINTILEGVEGLNQDFTVKAQYGGYSVYTKPKDQDLVTSHELYHGRAGEVKSFLSGISYGIRAGMGGGSDGRI